MTWYEQWFDRNEYDLVYRNRDADDAERLVGLVVDLAAPPVGSHVLDVGCGRGRHSLALARRGFQVTGLDLSKSALRRAREAAEQENLAIRFVRGDMRDPVDPGGFDLVVNLFTAFGYFEREADHLRALEGIAQNLKPGGVLVQDFFNADWIKDNLRPDDERTVEGRLIRQRRWIEEGRVKKEIRIDYNGTSHAFVESVALLDPDAFERLYAACGLVIRSRTGDYDGSAFSVSSPRLILTAARG